MYALLESLIIFFNAFHLHLTGYSCVFSTMHNLDRANKRRRAPPNNFATRAIFRSLRPKWKHFIGKNGNQAEIDPVKKLSTNSTVPGNACNLGSPDFFWTIMPNERNIKSNHIPTKIEQSTVLEKRMQQLREAVGTDNLQRFYIITYYEKWIPIHILRDRFLQLTCVHRATQ